MLEKRTMVNKTIFNIVFLLTNQSIKDSINNQGSGFVILISDVLNALKESSRKDFLSREERIEILEEAKKCYELYCQYGKGLEYNFFFSELEKIKLKLTPENVPHLLGIDQRLIGSPYGNYFRKYVLGLENRKQFYPSEILKNIFKDIEAVVDFNEENGKTFFHYYRIKVKCEIFKKLLKLDQQSMGRILFDQNYNKEMKKQKKLNRNSTEFLTILNWDNNKLPFSFVSIKPDIYENFYVPISLFLPYNSSAFFEGKTICFPEKINKLSDFGLTGRILCDEEIEILIKKIERIGNFEIATVKKKI